MTTLLTVTGRDVLFAHWPVDPDALATVLPEPLSVQSFDGSARVSALALENASVAPGRGRLPGVERPFPQLNVRTYVTHDGEPGVYFLALYSGRRTAAAAGRRGFGLPFEPARMRLARRGDDVVASRREGDPPAIFQARYRPTGDPSPADPGTVEEFCVERFRYFVPGPERPRLGIGAGAGLLVGEITHEPWQLQPVTATIRTNTLFEAAGLPAPTGDPVLGYSPGFEMGVEAPATESPEPGWSAPVAGSISVDD
jgi:hypothetical protein